MPSTMVDGMDTPGITSKLPSPTEDPEGALTAAVTLRGLAERLESAAVDTAIDQGWSWTQIAQALGVTKQAAHKKHTKRKTNKKESTK